MTFFIRGITRSQCRSWYIVYSIPYYKKISKHIKKKPAQKFKASFNSIFPFLSDLRRGLRVRWSKCGLHQMEAFGLDRNLTFAWRTSPSRSPFPLKMICPNDGHVHLWGKQMWKNNKNTIKKPYNWLFFVYMFLILSSLGAGNFQVNALRRASSELPSKVCAKSVTPPNRIFK